MKRARYNATFLCLTGCCQIFKRFCGNKRFIAFCLLPFLFATILLFLYWLLGKQTLIAGSQHKGSSVNTRYSGSLITQIRTFPRGGDESLIYDQPWQISSAKIYSNFNDLDQNQRYILGNFSYSPGLGNLIFQFAALRVLAEQYNAFLVLPSDCLLRKAFGRFNRTFFMAPSSLNKMLSLHSDRLKEIKQCCRHINFTLFEDSHQDLEFLAGYFQSYRYFHPKYKELIRDQLTFLPSLIKAAQQNLEEARQQSIQQEVQPTGHQATENGFKEQENDIAIRDTYTFVGIQARHGADITLNSRNMKHGHISAPPAYYISAINYYKTILPDQKLIFIVSSDDITWAKRNIVGKTKGEVFYLKSKHREIDLATLTQCNHTIISTGTFSWWTAYLSQGKTVRFKGWPRPGSELAKMVQLEQYFLPEWTAME